MVVTLATSRLKNQVKISVDAFTASDILARGALRAGSDLLRSHPQDPKVRGWLSGVLGAARRLLNHVELAELLVDLRRLNGLSPGSLSKSEEARKFYRFTASIRILTEAVEARIKSDGNGTMIVMLVDLFTAAQVLGYATLNIATEIGDGNRGNKSAVELLTEVKGSGQELIDAAASEELEPNLRYLATLDTDEIGRLNHAGLYDSIRKGATILMNAARI